MSAMTLVRYYCVTYQYELHEGLKSMAAATFVRVCCVRYGYELHKEVLHQWMIFAS